MGRLIHDALDRARERLNRTGTDLRNPVTGERIVFRSRPKDGTDDVLRFDYYLAPDGFAVGLVDHVHPVQEERIDVKSGRLGVRIDGDEWTATSGTRFAVLPETRHTLWNAGDESVHAVIEIEPGLAIDDFFRTMFALASAGRTNRWGIPGALQLAVILDEFRDEYALPGLPISIQRTVAGTIAPIGRRAGYDARPSPDHGSGRRGQ